MSMSHIVRRKAVLCFIGGMVVLSVSSDLHAAGFQLREQSAEGLGNAFAGSTAKAYDLSTIYYNPAGMARLDGTQTAGSVTYIMPEATFNGSASRGGRAISGTTGQDAIMDAAVGSVFAMWDARPDLKVGLAVTAPFGLRSHYKGDWVGRYYALQSNVTDINATPSFSYRLTDSLSIGGGLQIAYVKVTLSNAINFGALVPGAGDGKSTVQGDDIGYGGVFGLLWEVAPGSRIGLNYRSQIQHTLNGKANIEGTPTRLPLALRRSFDNDRVSADLTTPDTVSLGVYHEVSPRWAVMGDLQWTRWSSFKELRIKYSNGRADSVVQENWRDTLFASAGASYESEGYGRFQVGLAYDQSATADAHRTARIPDSSRYWLTAGYSCEVLEGNRLSLSYAHLFADRADIEERGSALAGTLVGSYDNSVDIVSLGLSTRF